MDLIDIEPLEPATSSSFRPRWLTVPSQGSRPDEAGRLAPELDRAAEAGIVMASLAHGVAIATAIGLVAGTGSDAMPSAGLVAIPVVGPALMLTQVEHLSRNAGLVRAAGYPIFGVAGGLTLGGVFIIIERLANPEPVELPERWSRLRIRPAVSPRGGTLDIGATF